MKYESNGQLLDARIADVDAKARFPLGKRVIADNGLVFRYLKASAALTAGTAYAVAPVSVSTATAPADNTIAITATTPAIAGVVAEDLVGVPVVAAGKVLFITSASKNAAGTTITATVPGVKKSDTVATATAAYALIGGTAASGVKQCVPVAALKSGEYGWAYEVADKAPAA